jgi:translation initiation factor IF-2
MRARGIKVADIAVLVVAADDGIMPQTVEAIKRAQAVGIPLIVAINKIDKATPAQIEAVKRGLAVYNLLPEEWGGQTVCVPISAKIGTGVNELLEVIVLQAQLLELTANMSILAQGYVLESKIEKGFGAVATVICQHGTLHIGDYFTAGITQGKVSSLINSYGQRIKSVGPSLPVQVAGFSSLPQAGDPFRSVTQQELKRAKSIAQERAQAMGKTIAAPQNSINLIIKTDGASSKEALLTAISKLPKVDNKEFYVVHAAVGDVSESDVLFARDTHSTIYGLHIKTEPNASSLAMREGVQIKLFDIIYKLLEDLEAVALASKAVKMVSKKIGEATVLKVFDIKNIGVIAGAQVKTGRCSRDSRVIIYRGKQISW